MASKLKREFMDDECPNAPGCLVMATDSLASHSPPLTICGGFRNLTRRTLAFTSVWAAKSRLMLRRAHQSPRDALVGSENSGILLPLLRVFSHTSRYKRCKAGFDGATKEITNNSVTSRIFLHAQPPGGDDLKHRHLF